MTREKGWGKEKGEEGSERETKFGWRKWEILKTGIRRRWVKKISVGREGGFEI